MTRTIYLWQGLFIYVKDYLSMTRNIYLLQGLFIYDKDYLSITRTIYLWEGLFIYDKDFYRFRQSCEKDFDSSTLTVDPLKLKCHKLYPLVYTHSYINSHTWFHPTTLVISTLKSLKKIFKLISTKSSNFLKLLVNIIWICNLF